jgi:hypothetical protein
LCGAVQKMRTGEKSVRIFGVGGAYFPGGKSDLSAAKKTNAGRICFVTVILRKNSAQAA